ncbi:spermatogenesis-associated protein 22-like isoform X2 [Dreissena polymorpha]|uniref:spermatogenesis-associated protein 22-like isoform X2 n=1 Tax=Dreissena polymorpha TaxID=45954 RepID=UPI00226505EA|nr:spermatogenesis-associated protein 22-like isoform X2 [Dreissena polymorpha]
MQQNNIYGLRAPAPIFNYRKRPRQAITADPPSGMTGPSGDASFSNSDFMPVGGFQRTLQSVHQMPSGTKAAGGQRNNAPSNNRFSNVHINNNVPSQPRYPTTIKKQNNVQQPHTESYNPKNRNTTVSKSSAPVQKKTPSNSEPEISVPQTNPRQKFNFIETTGQKTPDSVAHDRKNLMQMGPMLQPENIDEWENMSEYPTMLNIDKQSKPRASIPQMKSSNNTSSCDLEKSTHFITCDVKDVQRWASLKDKLPVLLETCGYLNSNISRAAGDCKEFMIRDEKNTMMKCVFYEIDRDFPKVTRGQCYRLVGTYDIDKQHFMCLSLRAASENERKMAATLAKKSSLFMSKLIREIREP